MVSLRVTPIAYTTLIRGRFPEYVSEEWLPIDLDATEADNLAEFAGRRCYNAWGRKNPSTATNQGYLANILSQGHESVLEHASVTFHVEGVSRSLLAELTRHRHLSFSVVSQRYVDAGDLGLVMPPIVEPTGWADDGTGGLFPQFGPYEAIEEHYARSLGLYHELVSTFEAQGYGRKRAREAARAVMPNSTESPFVVTGNLRAWRDVLKKRYHVAADAEIQLFAKLVLFHLQEIAPNSVQDIPADLYGSD